MQTTRDLGRQLDWSQTEEALLKETREHWPEVAFSYHLEFGEVGRAFDRWESIDSWSRRDRRRAGDELIEAAQSHDAPDIVLAVATANAGSRIEHRGRDNYADACEYLQMAREILNAGEVPVDWETIIGEYDDRLDRLPAFHDAAKKAGLIGEEPNSSANGRAIAHSGRAIRERTALVKLNVAGRGKENRVWSSLRLTELHRGI